MSVCSQQYIKPPPNSNLGNPVFICQSGWPGTGPPLPAWTANTAMRMSDLEIKGVLNQPVDVIMAN